MVVEAVDPEQVRAALRGPIGAGVAADRLTQALGEPLPRCRPRVTASAVGHLARAGLLVRLGGDAAFPDVHPDQVAALARRRDLPALLDRHVPLDPDQATRRLGVRRTDWDQVARLGFVAPVDTVAIDYKSHAGVTVVPLHSALDIALLPNPALRAGTGRRPGVRAGTRAPLNLRPRLLPADSRNPDRRV
ncbi:hypothetical protein OG851_02410 [Streptomyces sp. NBC_00161]|uniref:hypothetical protein n=1 Tax=Streptomyces sp. NBC_00161 TaxID=2975671 RepID=UPI003247F11B